MADIRDDVKYTIKAHDQNFRVPVSISSGCHVRNFSPPKADPTMINVLGGTTKRMAVRLPEPTNMDWALLRETVMLILKENGIKPLDLLSDVSVETWLSKTHYPEWRKAELRECWNKIGGVLGLRHYIVGSFCKDETNADFKFARAINARSDEFKCAIGPIVKLIEEQIYQMPCFVKHIPVVDRPKYITEMLDIPGSIVVATDYTSYESHFNKKLMSNLEFVMYEFMTQHLPDHEVFMGYMNNVVAGVNVCRFKRFNMMIEATRMSGEMTTSLGNGFANYVLMRHMCRMTDSKIVGVVEGDDSLCVISGVIPTKEDFASIGLNIKLDEHVFFNEASFCGLIFDRQDLINVSDPADILLNFGWCGKQYVDCKNLRLLELLRAKSMSFAYMYRGCPIVQALAHYGMRMTRNIKIESLLERKGAYSDVWQRERLLEAMLPESIKTQLDPPINTRMLVQSKFGIPVPTQILIEEYLNNKTDLSPLDHPLIDSLMTVASGVYDEYYTAHRGENFSENMAPYKGDLESISSQISFTDQAEMAGVREVVYCGH